MTNKVRFGVLGSGYMGQTHAEAIVAHPGAELVAIAGGSRAFSLAARHNVVCEVSVNALIARRDIDAIVVATPHYVHVNQALPAIEAGKHVLVEKPLATTIDDCDRMIRAAAIHGVVLSVGYQQRFRTNNVRARELVRSNAIGRICTFQISMPSHIAIAQAGGFGGTWEWWNNPASVGHVLNAAPHAIDLMRWLTASDLVTVSAFSRTFRADQAVEDTTQAILQFSRSDFSNEMIGSLFTSCALPAPSFPHEDFRIRMVGTRGLLDLDAYHELRISDDAGWRTVSTQAPVGYEDSNTAFGDPRMQAYRSQMSAFIDAIRGSPSGAGTGLDGRAGVEAVIAMLISSRERRWVDLQTSSQISESPKP
jgi:predicted dehydrogenase